MLMTAIEATYATEESKERIAKENQIKEEQRQKYIAEVAIKTIAYCESTVAEYIEQAIKNGFNAVRNTTNMPWFTSTDKNGVARIIKRAKETYANGDPSFYGSSEEIIPDVMIDYLTAHGYKVTKKSKDYRQYWCGTFSGYVLEISWN